MPFFFSEVRAVTYLKVVLSAVAAIFAELLGSVIWMMFKLAGPSKAIGISALLGMALGRLFSPLFWVFAILLFALLFAAGRLGNKSVRVVLFWFPAMAILIVGFAVFSLFAYLLAHPRHG